MTLKSLRSSAGFTYIGALVMVILMGIMLSQAAEYWTTRMRREREAELIYHGTKVRDGLRRRYGLTTSTYGSFLPPGSPPVNPPPVVKVPANAPRINELKDLLNGTDTAGKVHFIRASDYKITDPVTGKLVDWELYKDPATQRIMGVFLKNENQPIKQANFPLELEPTDFEGKKQYSDWIFICDRYPKPGAAGGGITGLKTTSGKEMGTPPSGLNPPGNPASNTPPGGAGGRQP